MDLCTVTRLSAGAARRELARRVVDQGWTLAAAAEAAGVSVRCARKWVGRYRAGDRQVLDRSSAPRRVANRTCPGAGRGDREAAPAADDGCRDRRDACDATVDCCRDPDPGRDGVARPARARAASPVRALAAGRARARRRQEARAGSSAAPASAGATASTSTTPAATPMRPAAAA